MTTKFMLLSKEDAQEPNKIGYAFAKAHKSDWITCNDEAASEISVGTTKGADFIVNNDKVYMIMKVYFLLGENTKLIVGTECITGCEVKQF